MKGEILKYVHLRVYKNLSNMQLLNMMLCNRIMKIPILVNNSRPLYNLSSKIFGKTFTTYLINQTFCKALTAGNTLQEADRVSNYFRKLNIPVILDYCAQGQLGHQELESTLDANSTMFKRSVQMIKNQKNEMISIKITGLIDMKLLKKLNDSVLLRDQFFAKNNKNGKITSQIFLSSLQKMYQGITQQQFEQYVTTIFKYKGQLTKFQVDEFDFKMNHHPFYLYEHQKNQNSIIKLFNPLSQAEVQKCYNFCRRVKEIVEPQANNKTGLRILVDAEQSYVQLAIQCFSEQLQEKFNKQIAFIIPTIQNYLKRSVNRSAYQIQIANRKGLKFAAKLVRGAYIVEQTKLAKINNSENPVVDCFERTTQNYLNSFRLMVKNTKNGQIVVATHNQDTINDAIKIYKEENGSIKLSFAQLLGLADHLTWKVQSEKYRVYKYLPWAKTQVMIAYMIRRAEQLNQMRYPLDTQYGLLKHEIKQRIIN